MQGANVAKEEIMLKAIVLTTTALALAAAPALAASFYVAHAPHSKRCSIVETRPDGRNLIEVGAAHSSHSAAMQALHTSVHCTSTGKGS